jgi:hypothetical protein
MGRRGYFGEAQSPGGGQGAAEQKLDLAVEAAQVVVGPVLDRIQDRRINPQKKCFTLGHVIPLVYQCYTETQRHREIRRELPAPLSTQTVAEKISSKS